MNAQDYAQWLLQVYRELCAGMAEERAFALMLALVKRGE